MYKFVLVVGKMKVDANLTTMRDVGLGEDVSTFSGKCHVSMSPFPRQMSRHDMTFTSENAGKCRDML